MRVTREDLSRTSYQAYNSMLDATLALLAIGEAFDLLPTLGDLNLRKFLRLGSALQFAEEMLDETRESSQHEAGLLLESYAVGLIARAHAIEDDPEAFQIYIDPFAALGLTLQNGIVPVELLHLAADLGIDFGNFLEDEPAVDTNTVDAVFSPE